MVTTYLSLMKMPLSKRFLSIFMEDILNVFKKNFV